MLVGLNYGSASNVANGTAVFHGLGEAGASLSSLTGVWERGAVYTVVAWELLTDVLVLVRSPQPKKTTASAGATARPNGAAP